MTFLLSFCVADAGCDGNPVSDTWLLCQRYGTAVALLRVWHGCLGFSAEAALCLMRDIGFMGAYCVRVSNAARMLSFCGTDAERRTFRARHLCVWNVTYVLQACTTPCLIRDGSYIVCMISFLLFRCLMRDTLFFPCGWFRVWFAAYILRDGAVPVSVSWHCRDSFVCLIRGALSFVQRLYRAWYATSVLQADAVPVSDTCHILQGQALFLCQ